MAKEILTDSDKLLLFLESAEQAKKTIDDKQIDYLIFLLNKKGVSFGYNFYFPHQLYSQGLHDDIRGLEEAKLVTMRSPIEITQKGKTWVEENLPNPQCDDARKLMVKYLLHMGPLDEITLFEMAYAVATRGI